MMAFCVPVVLHEHGEHPLSLLSAAEAAICSWSIPTPCRLQAGKGELKALILSHHCTKKMVSRLGRPPPYGMGGYPPHPPAPRGRDTYTDTDTYIYIYTYTHNLYICTYTYCIHTYTPMYIYIYIYYLHIRVLHIYIYNNVYIHIDTHILVESRISIYII